MSVRIDLEMIVAVAVVVVVCMGVCIDWKDKRGRDDCVKRVELEMAGSEERIFGFRWASLHIGLCVNVGQYPGF